MSSVFLCSHTHSLHSLWFLLLFTQYFALHYIHIVATPFSFFFTSQHESKPHNFSLICALYKSFIEKTQTLLFLSLGYFPSKNLIFLFWFHAEFYYFSSLLIPSNSLQHFLFIRLQIKFLDTQEMYYFFDKKYNFLQFQLIIFPSIPRKLKKITKFNFSFFNKKIQLVFQVTIGI